MLPDKLKKKISEIGTDFNENKLARLNILKGFKVGTTYQPLLDLSM